MDFTSYLQNPSLCATATGFFPISAQRLTNEKWDAKTLLTGARVLPNGDVSFKYYAPTAEHVSVEVGLLNQKTFQEEMNWDKEALCARGHNDENTIIDLTKDDQGCFSAVLPWDSKISGSLRVKYIVDGVAVVDPNTTAFGGEHGVSNSIEVPDPTMEDILIRDVPHGSVSMDIYWSNVMNKWVRQMVYTPPGYRQSDESYPVVYLHQGRGGTETGWVYEGKVPAIMDNLIADGKAVPSIIVMNDGMLRTPEDGERYYDGFIRMIIEDTIPYVEANYRCKCDKWNRALAGLSMGGMQASQGGLGNPDKFAWLGLFSCSIRPRDTELDFDKCEYLNILKDKERAEKEFRLIYRINGIGELMRDVTILDDDEWIAANGVDKLSCYKRSVPRENGGEHDWNTFRRAFRDFMTEAFK